MVHLVNLSYILTITSVPLFNYKVAFSYPSPHSLKSSSSGWQAVIVFAYNHCLQQDVIAFYFFLELYVAAQQRSVMHAGHSGRKKEESFSTLIQMSIKSLCFAIK